MQEVLLASPRKAKEVAAVRALVEIDLHCCLAALAREAEPQKAHTVLEEEARRYLRKLGIDVADDDFAWSELPRPSCEDVALYEAVKTFSDFDLDGLNALLVALSFGQKDCEHLDTGDTLFNRVAIDLGVDMRNHWKPERSFIERRTRGQLAEVAKECGYAEGRSLVGGYKKSELVTGLLKHFARAFAAATPTPAQEKARNWLPGVMLFPAIDPDESGAEEVGQAIPEAA